MGLEELLDQQGSGDQGVYVDAADDSGEVGDERKPLLGGIGVLDQIPAGLQVMEDVAAGVVVIDAVDGGRGIEPASAYQLLGKGARRGGVGVGLGEPLGCTAERFLPGGRDPRPPNWMSYTLHPVAEKPQVDGAPGIEVFSQGQAVCGSLTMAR